MKLIDKYTHGRLKNIIERELNEAIQFGAPTHVLRSIADSSSGEIIKYFERKETYYKRKKQRGEDEYKSKRRRPRRVY